jgi:hypothetical protein
MKQDDTQTVTMQSIFKHIGGHKLILELVDKAFRVLDDNISIFEI